MSLSDVQWEFLLDVAELITYAEINGYKLTGGELKRTKYQQAEYVLSGKSQTMASDHLRSLAIDFNIFFDVDGDGDKEYTATTTDPVSVCRSLGDYWKSLHHDNGWGGDWGWDTPHFFRKF